MAVFKYFSHEAHAFALMERGELMLQPLSHFRVREADGIRGDPNDATLIYAPPSGLVMNMEDGRAITLDGGSFNSTIQQNDIFVYCASNQLSADLAEKFGKFCAEITDVSQIERRLKVRATRTSQLDYQQIVSGKVDYRELSSVPGADWALPERLVLIKPPSFAWQDEFRIAVGKRGAMDVENVRLTIQTGPPVAGSAAVAGPIFIRLGALTDFTTLRRFG